MQPEPIPVHICEADNGHVRSPDCWCEPNRIYHYTNRLGIPLFVTEHNDETLKHRIVVVSERERDFHDQTPESWVTRILEAVPPPHNGEISC